MSFDPDKVTTYGLRNGMMGWRKRGKYVLSSDYNQLLQLHHDLRQSLHIHLITSTRAIAEGYDVAWLATEIERQQKL